MFGAVLMMGGLGLVVGIGLALASKVFYVYVDPKVIAIDDILPGANCGGCGLPGCTANAEAIVLGRSGPNSCVAAGDDVSNAIAAVMGISVDAREPEVALPDCTYGLDEADTKFVYNGLEDCRAVVMLSGGMKVCTIGCVGLGTCIFNCPFSAISQGADGLPTVDKSKCTGCGVCERVCPKGIIKLSSVTRRILKEYTSNDCTSPCQRACPAGINIPKYINLVSKNDYDGAIQVIKERNPFPAIIGRICPRPCENECRRKFIDQPVAINALKRFSSEYEMKTGRRVIPSMAPSNGRKVAVIGGGVHGLSVAFFTARLGYKPTVFESTDKLGGILNNAISKKRLPQNVLDWDIQGLSEMGIGFEMNKIVGLDITVKSLLKDNFKAVFVATGGWDSRMLRSGYSRSLVSPFPGGGLVVDFVSGYFSQIVKSDFICGGKVLFVGGENSLKEIIHQSKKLKLSKIIILSGNSRYDSSSLSEKFRTGIEVEVILGHQLSKILGRGNRMSGAELLDLESGNVKTVSVQAVFFPGGRFPEMIFSPKETDVELSNHNIRGDSGVFWSGYLPHKSDAFDGEFGAFANSKDVMSDFSSAIRAIAAGRRSSAYINDIVGDGSISLRNTLKSDSFVQNVSYIEGVSVKPRDKVFSGEIQNLSSCYFETERDFDTTVIAKEALRCLKCGLICYESSK